jgi:hypothetical protein
VHAGDQLAAAHDSDGIASEPHLVARVTREQHLVTGLDSVHLAPDRGEDSGAAVGLCGRREDQTEVRLRFLVGRLDDDEVVQWLEGEIDASRVRLLRF